MVEIEKLILKTKATDNLLLAPMERVPQSYPRKSVNSKPPKIELNSFTKPGSTAVPRESKKIVQELQMFLTLIKSLNHRFVVVLMKKT